MASTPSFDPNSISAPATAAEAWGQLNNDPRQPLLNHAAQDQLPPGSIFKIITTVAGLRSGYTPDSPLTGDAQIILPGTNVPLTNFGGQACAGGGQVTLTTAFALSCNTAFVQMGLAMGPDALRDAALPHGHLRPGSFHALALHCGRHGGQQCLWLPLGGFWYGLSLIHI